VGRSILRLLENVKNDKQKKVKIGGQNANNKGLASVVKEVKVLGKVYGKPK
jgi:hypothetical protein